MWRWPEDYAIGELGDKTQLLALILATRLLKPVPIIAGIFVATLSNHLIACLVGKWAGTLINPDVLKRVLGLSFLAVAAWALIPDKMGDDVKTRGAYGVFVVTVVTFFLAEMGDKTQIVALALAAKYNDLVPVVAGTTLGMMLVNVPTVLFAERATKWVPVKAVRVAAAAIYAVLGVATLRVLAPEHLAGAGNSFSALLCVIIEQSSWRRCRPPEALRRRRRVMPMHC